MKIDVFAIQTSAEIKETKKNVSAIKERIRRAAVKGADICVLPELCPYEFFPQWKDDSYYDYAQQVSGELVTGFAKVAKEEGIYILLPFFERHIDGVYYNSAALIGRQGEIIGVYRKVHIPFTKSYEKYYFTPGDSLDVFETEFGKVGVCICYDRRFPETIRELCLKGANLILTPISSSIIDGGSELPMWDAELRTRALENQCYIVACNRTGTEGRFEFFGNSRIIAPDGEILAAADETENMIISARIDSEYVAKVRRRAPLLRDRRPEIYTGGKKGGVI